MSLDLNDRYLCLLMVMFAGYALLGKGFAYVGYPPALIGEVALLVGLIVAVRTGCLGALFASTSSVLLAALIGLVTLRLLPELGTWGLDTIRDAVIVLYGLYAFIAAALVLERPDRLGRIVGAYGRFALVYGVVGGLLPHITHNLKDYLPAWPTSDVPIIWVRPGEAALHIAGAAVFALVGLRKVSPAWVAVLCVSVLLVSTPSRGAMLSCLVPIALAAVLSGNVRRLLPIAGIGTAVLALLLVSGLEITMPSGRNIGARQVLANLESIAGSSGTANLDGTKLWRLRWWEAIVDYTVHGPYFWTGKGFGVGLAEADGFVVGLELGGPILRSPHNAHITMLARTGVPGLALWSLTLAAWLALVFHAALVARRRGDISWTALFTWIGCYGLAVIIDASFDVALEGPMVGICFWMLFGLGIAAMLVYRWQRAAHALGGREGVR
jgi:hypothetical protein